MASDKRPTGAGSNSFGAMYSRALDKEPVLTKGGTSFVLSCMSSIVAQLVTSGGVWNGAMPLNAAKFGVTKIPPYSHFWYPILERVNKSPIFRVIVDQVFWRPFLTAYTIFFMSVVQGLSWPEIREKFRSDYLNAVKSGLRIWPACEIVNQTVVPLKWRTTTKDVVGFFWDVYIMMVSTSKREVTPAADSDGAETTETTTEAAEEDRPLRRRRRRVLSVYRALEDEAEAKGGEEEKGRVINPVIPITAAIFFIMVKFDASSRQKQKKKRR